MSVATVTTNTNLGVNANFQALMGAFIDANIQAFGMVYTAQTGDIDPNTAASPAAGTFAGFRVYKSNDGLTDYYLRLDFGIGVYDSLAPMLKYQIGTSVDGSGVLGGQTSTAQTIATQHSANAAARQYMSGTAGRLSICLTGTGNLGGANCMMFSVGRTVDVTGAPSATGIELFQTLTYLGGCLSQYVPLAGTIPSVEPVSGNGWPVVMTTKNPATIGSATLFGVPQLFGENGGNNKTLCVAVHDPSSLTPATSVSLTLYGVSHDYLVMDVNNVFAGLTTARALMRYE